MFTKLVMFAAALVLVSPVFAATAGGSAGGSSAGSAGASQVSSGGGGHSGGGGGGGGGGGHGGGDGGHGGATLGGHGASHATASHAIAVTGGLGSGHSAHDSAGKHVQSEHSTSRVTGMHHPHPPGPHHRRFREEVVQQGDTRCVFRIMVDKWLDCFGATKSGHLARPANRS